MRVEEKVKWYDSSLCLNRTISNLTKSKMIQLMESIFESNPYGAEFF